MTKVIYIVSKYNSAYICFMIKSVNTCLNCESLESALNCSKHNFSVQIDNVCDDHSIKKAF